MTADGHQPALVTPNITTRQANIKDHGNGVSAKYMLGYSHAPDEDSGFRLVQELSKFPHIFPTQPRLLLENFDGEGKYLSAEFIEPNRMGSNEFLVFPAVLEQEPQYPVEKSDVAALCNREPVIHDIRPEDRAVKVRWHPVSLHARFAIGV